MNEQRTCPSCGYVITDLEAVLCDKIARLEQDIIRLQEANKLVSQTPEKTADDRAVLANRLESDAT